MTVFDVALRLLAAVAIGALVGMQREMVHSSAGFRTHTLVSLGACLAMLTNQYLFEQYSRLSTMDVARMGSYVLGGIGFLGAGTIVKDGLRVRGLTTAASLWTVAALGLAAGCGFWAGALIAGVLTVTTLWLLKVIEERSFARKGTVLIQMEIRNHPGQLAAVLAPLVELGCSVQDVHIEPTDAEWLGLSLRVRMPAGVDAAQTREHVGAVDGVRI